jgi:hypothetical protein
MTADARLVLRHAPAKVAPLDRDRPLTIGQAAGNRLCLPSLAGVAAHHAVVRHSQRHGWIVCDWQSGAAGTWLEGQRIRRCRPLGDGDEIQLGRDGPVLVFQLSAMAAAAPPAPGPAAAAAIAQPSPSHCPEPHHPTGSASPAPSPPRVITLAGRPIPMERIRSAQVRSRPRHPHSFSWWLLACLGGLVLLPWPWLFWPLETLALGAWIVLGSRKEHTLMVTMADGMALRHGFANRITALSHRNGIRKAIGQSLESP